MSKSDQTPHTGKHIVIAAYGTLGDVYPFLQLALTLQERGHRITVATSDIYQDTLEKIGLTFFPIRPNLDSLGQTLDEFGKKLMDSRKGSEYIYREVLIPNLRDSYADLAKAAEGADLLVSHPLVLAASLLSEKTGIRWISTVLAPLSFSSKYDPSVFKVNPFPDPRKLPPFLVGWIISAIKKGIQHWMKPIQEFRTELGLPPGKDPLFEGQHSPHRVLALFSEDFAKSQRDWPSQSSAPGFIFYDSPHAAEINPELEKFLKAGAPTVVFTLGSSAIFSAGEFYAESLKAVRQLGCRAVFLTGGFKHAGIDEAEKDENIFVVDYAPHRALFEKASVVVHQGGIGTTAQTLRSGKPMLVVPHAHDQPDNAMRVARLGVGEFIPANDYKAAKVVKILGQLLKDSSYAKRAAQFRENLHKEDGTGAACAIIEEQL